MMGILKSVLIVVLLMAIMTDKYDKKENFLLGVYSANFILWVVILIGEIIILIKEI